MKKIKVLLIAVFLITAGSYFQQAVAQDKTKAEQEKEAKLQQEIDQQKKALTDQKKSLTDQKKALDESVELKLEKEKKMQELMNDANFDVVLDRKAGDIARYNIQRGARSFSGDVPFIWSGPGSEAFYGHSFGNDSEGTTWDFSKSVKENTFARDYTFDVEKTSSNVVMSVMGDCKSGEIRIKIITPGGKTYSDILIDASGNLNWRKSFQISETENQDKTGEWKFQIASNKATGFFKISLQTY